MKVIRAKVLGFCIGVRRAVETAYEALENSKGSEGRRVFTLGPLIHNPLVMDSLRKNGAEILEPSSLELAGKNSVVVIRAHGTTPQTVRALEEMGAEVLDATCPRVHLSQKRAAEWAEKGFLVVIAGDRNHGEVVSISGYAENSFVVVENADEARGIELPEKAVLIAQTTFSPVEFEKIASVLQKKNPLIQIFNSICSATMERQNALRELSEKTEAVLVIGGKNSANTRRLYETASSICANTALIEDASEIPGNFFDFGTVGLTAGASTPDFVIDEVERALLEHHLN
ncbi:4-hydroxy-3-methylbut-2-enyl diphosphate reductase [Treponema sp.]|uniref:4-hydroxy-3-methylbut-2-enyl diphosphate reductase n=1 Tax=Treponema sp. TaxID=166 RepID=UPI003EFE4558